MLHCDPSSGSSSKSAEASESKARKFNAPKVIPLNTSVYELYSPAGTPTMEVVFFHGFQDGNYDDAHRSTWRCGDGSDSIWPQTWLVEEFGDARILSVSYNANVLKSHGNEHFDLYNMGENLISDLLDASLGQEPCRPVILVGHSFGGLVIKQLCVHMASERGFLKGNCDKSYKLSSLLENVKGIFFYSTPHHGITDNIAEQFVKKGPLLEYVTTLSTSAARLNDNFDRLRGQLGQYNKWQIAAVGESTKLGGFPDLVVKEASSRFSSDFNLVEGADHISVCRPINKTSRSFDALKNFLGRFTSHSKAMVHGLPAYPTALERRAFEVQVKLLLNLPHHSLERQDCVQRASVEHNCLVLGIVGMGGIGKTTIAKELFKNISGQFEYTCFVDNAKGMKVHKLKDWVLNHSLRNGTRVDHNSLQWSNLQKKKCLIAMDDVDSESQVEILSRLDEFGSGSRVIFTTRDKGVLNTLTNCVIYEVDLLKPDEARKLFCQHAFQQEGIPDDLTEVNCHLEENVKEVVEKCDGLPLTLEVIGCYLRDHKTDTSVWKETLHKLGNAQPVHGLRKDRLWSSLRLSYDTLLPEEQGMFIEAGTYFFEQPVETALAAWSTAFGDSVSGWANLLRTSMVKEVDKTEWDMSWRMDIKYKEVWVHEQLRDLAKHLSKGAIISSSVGESYRALDLLNANAVQAQTSILEIWGNALPDPKVQLELLGKLGNLKYLELLDIIPEGPSSTFSRKLCLLKCNSSSDQQRRLLLNLEDNLMHLKILPISLEDLKNLAVLQLKCWTMTEESIAALGRLNNLRILSLSHIAGLHRLPKNFCHLSQLKCLELSSVWLTKLPDSFGNLSSLEHLLLDNMPNLKELPESFGNLRFLAKLVITDCKWLACLPESFGRLSSLTDLRILGCLLLRTQRTELRQIDLHEATATAGRIETIRRTSNLSSLRSLCIQDTRDLTRLPASFEFLSSLEELELVGCMSLRTLPESIGQFTSLKRLIIERSWRNLQPLPDSFGNLRALAYLRLSNCSIRRLPESFGNLSALQQLKLEDLPLESLPDTFGRLSALKRLFIREVHDLLELPASFGNLSSLETLSIAAGSLQGLPASIGKLSALKKLDLRAEMLSSLPEELGDLSSLQILRIGNCASLETLPDSLWRISSLRVVILADCSKLKSLSDSLGKICSPHRERSAETSRPVAGHSSQTASTEALWLHVYKCPSLSDSVLQTLGWIQSDEQYFVPGHRDGMFVGCFGKWYLRECPGEGQQHPVHTQLN